MNSADHAVQSHNQIGTQERGGEEGAHSMQYLTVFIDGISMIVMQPTDDGRDPCLTYNIPPHKVCLASQPAQNWNFITLFLTLYMHLRLCGAPDR